MLIALSALVVVASLIGLVFGADRFVDAATVIARGFGVSPLLVGMAIVGLGTSAPEMLVSVMAALKGEGGLAIGNALGSNIGNIGLVLGTTALIGPIVVHRDVLREELSVLLLVSFGSMLLFVDGELGPGDGCFLLLGLVLILARMIRRGARDAKGEGRTAKEPNESIQRPKRWRSAVALLIGLGVLLISSKGIVWGGTNIAQALGVSQLIIGLTVVAIGTSLPELAASVTSARRGEHEMAVGNIIGSNTFNLLAVLPFPALLDGGEVDAAVMTRDAPTMLAFTITLGVLAYGLRVRGVIGRPGGAFLLLGYLGYLGYLVGVGLRVF